MIPASFDELADTDNPRERHLKFLLRLLDWKLLLIPRMEFERVRHKSESEIAAAAIQNREKVITLVNEGVVSWGLLPGIFSNLRILTTTSRHLYDTFVRHPLCTKVRFLIPFEGYTFFFSDPNRQRVNLVYPIETKALDVCRQLYKRYPSGRPISVTKPARQVIVQLPPLEQATGVIENCLYTLYQRESAYFALPEPEQLMHCLGLRESLALDRADFAELAESKLLKFAVKEDAF